MSVRILSSSILLASEELTRMCREKDLFQDRYGMYARVITALSQAMVFIHSAENMLDRDFPEMELPEISKNGQNYQTPMKT